MTRLVRAATLTGYAALASRTGLDPGLPAAVGLPRASLTDPDLRIPVAAVGRLLEAAGQVDEAFGLRLAEARQISNLGIVALVVREQPTLGAALETLTRYIRLHNEALGLRVSCDGGLALVEPVFAGAGRPGRQAIELSMGVLIRVLRALAGPDWRPLRVILPHARPKDFSLHRRVFGPAVEFGGDLAVIVLAEADLARPIASADPVLARQLTGFLDDLAGRAATTFSAQVRELARALLPGGLCTVERIAMHLGVDRRTVCRRLRDEGLTFSGLLLDLRLSLARRHLADGERSLTQISEMLGFSALSAFSRWRRIHAARLA